MTWSRVAALGLLVLILSGVANAPRAAEARAGSHPLYDDGGTLRWYTDLKEAFRVAGREGKLVVVDVSVANCRACETAIGLVGDASIRNRIARIAVGYHVDARRGTPLIGDFRTNLRSASYLPLVGFFTPSTEWVSGFAPSQRTGRVELRRRFLVALDRAESRHRRMLTRRRREARAAPPVAPPARRKTAAKSPPARATPKPRKPVTSSVAGPSWYESISEAREAARSEGKIVFVTSTKPGCSLCKKLKLDIVPRIRGEMSKGCVFYIYDITRPESKAVDRLVRRNLPRARLMPLAGFMTPDWRWLHGFSGGTDARKLMTDYRTALRKR